MKEDVLVSYYLTSIYDHSSLEAFSKVVAGALFRRSGSVLILFIYLKIGHSETCGSVACA